MSDEGQTKVAVERNRYREFTVTPGLCGFKVKIGCTEAYFGKAIDVCAAISDYFADPVGTERKFQNGDIRQGCVLANGTVPIPPMVPIRSSDQAERAGSR